MRKMKINRYADKEEIQRHRKIMTCKERERERKAQWENRKKRERERVATNYKHCAPYRI